MSMPEGLPMRSTTSSWPATRCMWSPRRNAGAFLKRTTTSVAVTGIRLPARMMIGTPAQRQVSQCSRTAT